MTLPEARSTRNRVGILADPGHGTDLRSWGPEPGPEGLRNRFLGPGPGIADPLPRDGDPRIQGSVIPGSQDRRFAVRDRCRSMLSIEGGVQLRP